MMDTKEEEGYGDRVRVRVRVSVKLVKSVPRVLGYARPRSPRVRATPES